jgi:hypothetical protein
MSMSVADIDRERLVNAYLDALIRIVEPEEKSLQSDAGARFRVGWPEVAGRAEQSPEAAQFEFAAECEPCSVPTKRGVKTG